jgi:catechol 2,3-dioxygenase-like lactoylglutathione lyase family enzyme
MSRKGESRLRTFANFNAPMPTLETSKKQAKLLVRWHRDRLYTVAQRLRDGLPRFAGLTDEQVLGQPFALADAQSVIAAEQGYPNWAALKTGLSPMIAATVPTPVMPRVKLVEATLFVADVQASCRYFEQVLGFATVFTYGEPPFFGQVARDGVPLNLRYVCEPVFVEGVREREDLLAAQIGVAGVKALYEEFKAAGATFHQGLKRHPWGAVDFVVKDPDGNLISFGAVAADAS